jgi:hypothetical protein
VIRVGRDPEREGQSGRVAVELPLDREPHSLGDQIGLVLGRVRQQDRELLAAGPRDRVAGAAVPQQHAPGAHERLVTRAVAEAVVHRLEVVEVADHEAQRLALAQRPLDVGVQLLVQREAVLQTRERVGEGRVRKTLHQPRDAVAHGTEERGRREQDPDERQPRRGHGLAAHGCEQDREVGARYQRQLRGGVARTEGVGREEAQPDVEHLARQRGLVLGRPGVDRHHGKRSANVRSSRPTAPPSAGTATRAEPRSERYSSATARRISASPAKIAAATRAAKRAVGSADMPLLFGFPPPKIRPRARRGAPGSPRAARPAGARFARCARRRPLPRQREPQPRGP